MTRPLRRRRRWGVATVLTGFGTIAACGGTGAGPDPSVGTAAPAASPEATSEAPAPTGSSATTPPAGPATSTGTAATTAPSEPSAPTGPTTSAATAEAPAGPAAPETTGPVADATDGSPRCWSADPTGGNGMRMVDATEAHGLVEPLTGMHGHAAAAGDVNGDGWTDLFVGTFADRPEEHYRHRGADGPSPDRLLLGGPDGFRDDPTFPGERARTSGALLADLSGDGNLELVAVRNPRGDDPIDGRPTTVFRQSADGWEAAATLLDDVAGRAVAAADIDRDGAPDLIVTADRWGGGSTTALRNLGDLRFEDATADWGVPDDMTGLALATVDLDGDGWVDVVVSGDERVLMGGPDGFRVEEHPVLAWETHGAEDDPAGIAVGDLTGDGRPDLVVGQHFNSTVDAGERVPVRVFLNRSDPGELRLVDVTDESGSPPLWTKSPHVAIADLDNDGRPDVITSAVAADGTPVILHNTGISATGDGVPRFEVLGEPGDGRYLVTGVEMDVNRDGRIDAFQVEWFPEHHSPLFVNDSDAGSWVRIDLTGHPGATGGTRIEVRDPDDDTLLGTAWVASTTGYAAGAAPIAHVGLGDTDLDHVAVTVHPPGGPVSTLTAPVNAHTSMSGC